MASSQTVQHPLPQKRKWPWVVAAVLLFMFIIGSVFGNDDSDGTDGTREDPPAAVVLPDGLPGMDAAAARDRLEDLDFQVTIESVDDRSVIIESNWNVVSASLREGRNVVLRVAKPAETTTAPPAVVEVPVTTTEPPPVEVAPAPEPAPEPAPSAYYANCVAAKAAGAAPLHAGEPGYRAALDRDKDGVACE